MHALPDIPTSAASVPEADEADEAVLEDAL